MRIRRCNVSVLLTPFEWPLPIILINMAQKRLGVMILYSVYVVKTLLCCCIEHISCVICLRGVQRASRLGAAPTTPDGLCCHSRGPHKKTVSRTSASYRAFNVYWAALHFGNSLTTSATDDATTIVTIL